jgi:hypothetical protein
MRDPPTSFRKSLTSCHDDWEGKLYTNHSCPKIHRPAWKTNIFAQEPNTFLANRYHFTCSSQMPTILASIATYTYKRVSQYHPNEKSTTSLKVQQTHTSFQSHLKPTCHKLECQGSRTCPVTVVGTNLCVPRPLAVKYKGVRGGGRGSK